MAAFSWIYVSRLLVVVTLLFMVVDASANLLVRRNVITVKSGRTVYLATDDLVFRKAKKADAGCRVEVVQNDPITQRVGILEPTIFDCSYQSKTVRYVHSGSPFLNEDKVKLRVHRFTNRKTISHIFYLHVRISNSSNGIIDTRGKPNVIVQEFNGVSNLIDGSVIRFHHSSSPNVSCTVSFNKWASHWPLVGHIVIGEQNTPVEGLKKTCQEFLFMELRYEHLQKPTPDVDYLPLKIELFDPEISDEVIMEQFYLPIYIKNALLNSPPRSSFMSMYMMDVEQFILTTIIPGIISAEDYETPNSLLVYNISKPTGRDQGYFIHLNDPTTAITSFLQDDLDNHRIAYQPPNISFLERRIYEVEFKVYDSHFTESMPIVLHIAVKPSSSKAPRISFNTGLVLLEGQSRVINTNNIQIVDKDSLDTLRIYVTGGVEHGQFLVNNEIANFFSVSDLTSENIKYVHDDSESTKDDIKLKISDGENNILVNFPISIVPKDDTPPSIVNNLGLQLNEGQTKCIDTSMLLAHDTDSVDLNIVYVISQPTSAGEIIRKLRPTDPGTRINKFTQRELTKGQIYYHHFGHEEFLDEFIFTLHDRQEPPNESGLETFYVEINPVNENPPQLSPEATRLIHVYETDIALITKNELEYTDAETNADQLTYTITAMPYFASKTRRGGSRSAGQIVSTLNLTLPMKDSNIQIVQTFKQEDINHLRIGYMPPSRDIGPEPRLVRFEYTVQGSNGNKVLDQRFDIDVQPVNDKAPEFHTSKLLVEEGGILGISIDQLSAADVDTNEADLVFILDGSPEHGRLQKGGVNLDETDTFNMLDLRRKDIRYIHDGSEVLMDAFTLSVSDGDNKISKVFDIHIVPIDDESPRVHRNLHPRLIVSEGSEIVITSKALAATDEDTDDRSLVFLIVKQPKYGIVQLRGGPATKFTQSDVTDNAVHYIHSSGEIGSHAIKDSVTFIVSDQHFKATADLPILILNLTITPVDNQKPNVIAGSRIVVEEGMKFVFSPDVITAKDPDTEPESIEFVITKQPQWGYLENTKPNPGSEKSNAGNPVTTFKLQDIIDESVNYIQATHKGVEPTTDSFDFYATDGKLNSPSHTAYITIQPMNDEEPDVMLNDIHIEEGGSKVIDQSMLDAIDLDKPKEQLLMHISQPPAHGDIVVMLHTPNGDIEASVDDFSAEQLHKGMQLKYRHDDSEHFTDNFAITVSDGKHETKKVCNVEVLPINDERPEITINAGLQLEYGSHAVLSSVSLQSVDLDNPDTEIWYMIVSLPQKGVLKYCTDAHAPTFSPGCRELQVRQNFTQADINNNNVRYLHTTGIGGSEFDSFKFVLSDGKNTRYVETFQIRIVNSNRANIALLNKGINITEGQRMIISTNNLSASDETTKAEEIVYAVIRPPHLGQIEYIDQDSVEISSFTQLDLASQKIVYNHLTKTDFTEDSFTFTVTNGMSDAKDAEFKIQIAPLDKVLPTLAVNSLVEVLQGNEITITAQNLRSDDPDTDSSNVTYLIGKHPTYGRLFNRGLYITSLFTQSAIDRGMITYESDGEHTGLDNFLFTVSDGKHDGYLVNGTLQIQPSICSIFIKPLVNDAPKLITNTHPESLVPFEDGRYGFELNTRVLKAVDSDTTNIHLVYVIKQKPKHGHLENSKAKRFVRRRFTQRDLDQSSLQFIIDTKRRHTNDSFTFLIQDNRGNKLDDQRIDFHWSYIEFEKSGLVVCENIGTLALTLSRVGDLSGTAFVSIEIQDRTTQKDEDYTTSSAKQVQFDPGMSTATWDVRVIADGVKENPENLIVYIREPVNAVLGRKRKVRVKLINAINGECLPYLGMISKHQPKVPDSLYLPDNGKKDSSQNVIVSNELNPFDTSRKNPFDNTYNTDPGATETDVTNTEARLAQLGQSSLSAPKNEKKRKRRKRKNKRNKNKRSRGRKKRRKNKTRKERKDATPVDIDVPPVEHNVAGQILQNVDIKAPQNCAMSTRGLLYFDPDTQEMYQCNGIAWQAWSPASNQDQQPETRECQQGWSKYEDRCFKFINERLTWEVAETVCQMSYGAHLSTVHSRKHLNWLSELSGKKAFWIGLNDKDETGVWKYTNGQSLVYSHWDGGSPRVKRMLHRKNCVIVNKGKQWKNKICNKRKSRLICELDIGAGEPKRSPPKRDIPSGGRSRGGKKRRSRIKDSQSDQARETQRRQSRHHRKSRTKNKKGFFYGN